MNPDEGFENKRLGRFKIAEATSGIKRYNLWKEQKQA